MTGPSNTERVLDDLAKDIRAGHRAAVEAARTAIEHAQRTGALLIEAKALVARGQWTAWLRRETKLSPRTAQRYMQIASNPPPVAGLGIKAMADALARTRYRAVANATDEVPGWCHKSGVQGDEMDVPIELVDPNPHWPSGPFVDSAAVEHWTDCARWRLCTDLGRETRVSSLLGYRDGRSYVAAAPMPLYFGARRLWEQGKASEVPMTVVPKKLIKCLAKFALYDLWHEINWPTGRGIPLHRIHAVEIASKLAVKAGRKPTPTVLAGVLGARTKKGEVEDVLDMARLFGQRVGDAE